MLPIVRGGFVVEDGLTLTDVFEMAHVSKDDALVVIDTDRADTVADSVKKFQFVHRLANTPGTVIEGFPTPLKNAVVRMVDVGVVIRNTDGARVYAPSNKRHLPTLYAPTNSDGCFAAFGPEIVARLAVYGVCV